MTATADVSEDHDITQDISAWAYWRPLVLTSAFYCILTFVAAALLAIRNGEWLLFFSFSAMFAQSQLSGIFAALGTGGYFTRLAISQGCLVVVFLGMLGGSFVGSQGKPDPDVAFTTLVFAVAASVMPQLAYGFFRFVRDWRFHRKGAERGPVFNLKDLFAITAYVSVVVSALNLAAVRSSVFAGEGVLACMVIAGILLIGTFIYGIPTLATTFKFQEVDHSFAIQMIIVATFGFVTLLPLIAIGANMVVGPLAFFLCGCSLFTWLPLVIMRERGFVLTNGKSSHSTEQNRAADFAGQNLDA
ncbi:hypothetical protein [Mariniblastus fucicola]|nr:hypothetical protein [Mariniblastus fucicola]